MPLHLEVLFSPAEFAALSGRDLSATTCVVFDVLRATSSMLTALNNGADAIIPVSEIAEALAIKRQRPDVLLAGEREGLRIRKDLTGSLDFEFGNSPREFTPARVSGKTLVMTTTNGTRALRSCLGAERILIGAFLNLGALVDLLGQIPPDKLLLVCSGTFEEAAYEDTLAAGALVEGLGRLSSVSRMSDSAHIAREIYLRAKDDLENALEFSRNARRLLANPDLAEDVVVALRCDSVPLNAGMMEDGSIRALRGFGYKLA